MIPFVLTYHSHNVSGNDYASNDHVALASDLATIARAGARIVPLTHIARALAAGRVGDDGPVVVGLSFDDGPVFDFEDFEHPLHGPQRGMANIMHDFARGQGRDSPAPCATSFVIASPEARAALTRAPECGYPDQNGWLGDAWWREASAEGTIEIGNHSWDHVHHAVPCVCLACAERDDFTRVDNAVDADRQICVAARFIRQRSGGPCRHFAFPYGHANRFLVEEYLPVHAAEHGLEAAFGTGGRAVAANDSIWNIPRFVCGEHWSSPEDLAAILDGAR